MRNLVEIAIGSRFSSLLGLEVLFEGVSDACECAWERMYKRCRGACTKGVGVHVQKVSGCTYKSTFFVVQKVYFLSYKKYTFCRTKSFDLGVQIMVNPVYKFGPNPCTNLVQIRVQIWSKSVYK